ncbi:hypothetical protein BC831DRAFT_514779 [Entophlyctis helioformis]|nr:hypothetical protein BC831DRAFT_514779 [Entophlyctis helioformis]
MDVDSDTVVSGARGKHMASGSDSEYDGDRGRSRRSRHLPSATNGRLGSTSDAQHGQDGSNSSDDLPADIAAVDEPKAFDDMDDEQLMRALQQRNRKQMTLHKAIVERQELAQRLLAAVRAAREEGQDDEDAMRVIAEAGVADTPDEFFAEVQAMMDEYAGVQAEMQRIQGLWRQRQTKGDG